MTNGAETGCFFFMKEINRGKNLYTYGERDMKFYKRCCMTKSLSKNTLGVKIALLSCQL